MCDYASYQPCPRSSAELFAEAEARKKKRDEEKDRLQTKKSPGIEFQERYFR
jgi:hypothetical protein